MRIAVSAHVCYLDQCDFIRKYLANIPCDYFLYITCTSDNDRLFIEDFFSGSASKIIVTVVPSHGIDLLPFLETLEMLLNDKIDIVCKVYTKDTTSNAHIEHRRLLFDSALGSAELIQNIINEFTSNDNLSMVSPYYLFRSADDLMYGNRRIYEDLCGIFDCQAGLVDHGFVLGAMSWFKVENIKILVEKSSQIKKLFNREIKNHTKGSHESVANAFERFIFRVPFIDNSDVKSAFTFSDIDCKVRYLNYSNNIFYKSSIEPYLLKSAKYTQWRKVIMELGIFDENAYRLEADIPSDLDALKHYLLIGEFEGYKPYHSFSPQYYYIHHSHLYRNGESALINHIEKLPFKNKAYLQNDRKDLQVAQARGAFSPTWYSDFYNDIRDSGLDSATHYLKYGYELKRLSSPSSLLLKNELNGNNFFDVCKYIREYAWQENIHRERISRTFQNGDYQKSYDLTQAAIATYYPSRFYYIALAISQMALRNWPESKILWENFWNDSKNLPRESLAFPMLSENDDDGNDIFQSININRKSIDFKGPKICVYTALYGDFDKLRPPLHCPDNIEFICFTDQPRLLDGWTVIVVEAEFDNNNLNAKIFKILPHKYLNDFEYSLFVDANTCFTGDIDRFIQQFLYDEKFVMWQHPERSDVYREAQVILQIMRYGEPSSIVEQVKCYAENGLPAHQGLCEASFIWRRHKDPEIIDFMEKWWSEIINSSKRDQLSLGYLIWKENFHPKVLPSYLGTSRQNYCFTKLPHANILKNHTQTKNTARHYKKNISFIYSYKHMLTGSTIMRGSQLSNLISTNLSHKYDVTYTYETFQKNSILFLTKGYLKDVTEAKLAELKNNGNILLFDFVDDKERKEIIKFADVLIASSISSYLDYCKLYDQCHIHLLTHHVDPRLKPKKDKSIQTFKAGYFGELVNTFNGGEINNIVSFHHVNTAKVDDGWLSEVCNFNFHYAIRKKRGLDGRKPFLKGFTASYFESNLLIQRSEKEALYYLSEDYPYIYDGELNDAQIYEKLVSVKESFGSKEWYYGLEIMKDVKQRCSDATVCKEFDSLIRSL